MWRIKGVNASQLDCRTSWSPQKEMMWTITENNFLLLVEVWIASELMGRTLCGTACSWHWPATHSLDGNLWNSSGPGEECLPFTTEPSSSEPSSSWPGAPQPSWLRTRAACRRSPSAAWCWGCSCSSWGSSGPWTVKVLLTTTTRSLNQTVHTTHTTTTPTWAAMPSLLWRAAASQTPSLCFCPGGCGEKKPRTDLLSLL